MAAAEALAPDARAQRRAAWQARRQAEAARINPPWPAEARFLPELAALIRAGDCCGLWEGKTDARLLAGYVVTPEQRRAIPVVGNPDPRVLRRLTTFWQAVGTAIGRRTGHIASPIVDLSDEGFGRAVLIAGRLVAVSRPLRDVHRFGFASLAEADAAGAALVDEGAALIAAHPDLVAL